jgi:hypothetical protein
MMLYGSQLKKIRKLIVFLLFMTMAGCSRFKDNNQIIGIKIYEYGGDYEKLVSRWNDMGINTAFISETLARDTVFRQILSRNNIAVFLIFPVFQDPDTLHADSGLYAITNSGKPAKDDWVEFVCPSRNSYRQQKIREAAALVRTLDPEGLSLDFIRQFVFWEMVYPGGGDSLERACFCDSCTALFTRTYDYSIPDTCRTPRQKADFLQEYYAVAYNDFRTGLIASMAGDLVRQVKAVKPGLRINVHLVPWRENDFGGAGISVAAQDLGKLAPFTDYFSPMCYSQMLKQDDKWIASVVKDMDNRAPGMILPSIQVYPYYIDDPFSPEDFRKCMHAALKPPSLGVVFWSWPQFEKDPERIRKVRQEL